MRNITSAKISVGYETDHSLIDINFALHSRGPGFWKLNNSFLNETEYINQIRAVIEETHNDYLHDNMVNNALLWEMIKFKTREHSIKYATAKRGKILREEELEKDINTLQNFIDSNESKSAAALYTLETKKRELENIEYRTKGLNLEG